MSRELPARIGAMAMVVLMVTSVVFSGAVAASDHDVNSVSDGDRVWSGQEVQYTNSTWANDTVDLKTGNGTFVSEIVADENGTVEYDTTNLDAGDYKIVGVNGSSVAFEVTEQSVSVKTNTSSVNNKGSGTQATFNLESNRVDYDVIVTSDKLSPDELNNETFSASAGEVRTWTDDNGNEQREYVLTNITNNNDPVADFAGEDAAVYDFQFDVYDTGVSDTASLTVRKAGSGAADFSQSIYQTSEGDRTKFVVSLEDTKTTTLHIGGADSNYNASATLVDDNGDGKVAVYFNTFKAGQGTMDAFSLPEGSEDIIDSQTNEDLGEPIDATTYDMTLSIDGSETDIATLDVAETDDPVASGGVAPGATDANATDIAEALTASDEVPDSGDYAVVELSLNGYDAQFEGLTAADLVKGADSDGIYVTMEQENDPVNKDAEQYDVSKATLVHDSQNNVAYVIYDPADFDGSSMAKMNKGDVVNTTLHVTTDNPYVEKNNISTSKEHEVVERTAAFDDESDVIEVENTASSVLTGTTTIAPGQNVTVVARSTADKAPFLKTTEVEVQADGTFAAEFNFENLSEGANFTVQVKGLSDKRDATLVPEDVATVSDSGEELTNEGQQTVTVDSVYLPNGGFVTVHDDTLLGGAPFDSVRGTSAYLEAGTHENVEVVLDDGFDNESTIVVMPHKDTDGDQTYDFVSSEGADDAPYTDDGKAVTDTATVTVEQETATVSDSGEELSAEGQQTVTVDSVFVPEGGFVTVHDSTLLDGAVFDSVRGTSAYLEAGTHENVEVALDEGFDADATIVVMPHKDTDGDETYSFVSSNGDADGPYTADGQAVVDTAEVTVPSMNDDTPTDEPTPTPTDEPEEVTPTPDDSDDTTQTTTEDGPGFGIILALVALAGAAFMATRRRD